jgi:hypothetical protein
MLHGRVRVAMSLWPRHGETRRLVSSPHITSCSIGATSSPSFLSSDTLGYNGSALIEAWSLEVGYRNSLNTVARHQQRRSALLRSERRRVSVSISLTTNLSCTEPRPCYRPSVMHGAGDKKKREGELGSVLHSWTPHEPFLSCCPAGARRYKREREREHLSGR